MTTRTPAGPRGAPIPPTDPIDRDRAVRDVARFGRYVAAVRAAIPRDDSTDDRVLDRVGATIDRAARRARTARTGTARAKARTDARLAAYTARVRFLYRYE